MKERRGGAAYGGQEQESEDAAGKAAGGIKIRGAKESPSIGLDRMQNKKKKHSSFLKQPMLGEEGRRGSVKETEARVGAERTADDPG